ncbi:O-antigen ligase family protein [Vibrio alginolyticus]|nr:O-antigen ligase family protein [Vibrio alginolyticus]
MNKLIFFGGAFYTFFVIYGLLLSLFYDGFTQFSGNSQIYFYIPFSFLCFVSLTLLSKEDEYPAAMFLFFYFSVSTALIIFLGGMETNFPPHFIFSYSDSLYSQGITKFYMIGALVSLFLAMKSKKIFLIINLLAFVVFISLSFLGSARGDFLFGIFVILVYLSFRYKSSFIMAFLFSLILLINFVTMPSYSEEFLMLQRLQSVADGNLGTRDLLISNAIELVYENPVCLLTGCGFNYFQVYHSYEFGLYPHNILMEYLITFGLIITFLIFLLFYFGFSKAQKDKEMTFTPVLSCYLLLLSLKSGSIFEFLTLAIVSYYFSFGMCAISDRLNISKIKKS